MTPVYAVALVAGVFSLLGGIAALAVSEMVAGWECIDPEKRYGRLAVAGLTGFGLAGMSSTFAGWHTGAAFIAALAGAGVVAAAAAFLAGETPTGLV